VKKALHNKIKLIAEIKNMTLLQITAPRLYISNI